MEHEVEQTRLLRETAAELAKLRKTQLRQETEQHTEKGRRQRARLKAELCYTLNEAALGTVLPRPAFDNFLACYLGEQLEPETVEENARELEAMILQHVQNSRAVSIPLADAPMAASRGYHTAKR